MTPRSANLLFYFYPFQFQQFRLITENIEDGSWGRKIGPVWVVAQSGSREEIQWDPTGFALGVGVGSAVKSVNSVG
jgi:hypothetical protein